MSPSRARRPALGSLPPQFVIPVVLLLLLHAVPGGGAGESGEQGGPLDGEWAGKGGGARRDVECLDCGPRCVATKVAKPMQGQCVGFTPAEFYMGDEIKAGQRLHRVQYTEMRSCVKGQAESNIRGLQAENRLTNIPFGLLDGATLNDAHTECKARWQDIPKPPWYFHTCNDPLRREEAQLSGYASAADFEPFRDQFIKAVAKATNVMAGTEASGGLVVKEEEVFIDSVRELEVCAKNASDPGDTCKRELPIGNAGAARGVSVMFHIEGHYDASLQETALDRALYVGDVYANELSNALVEQIGTPIQVRITKGRDATPCLGPLDTTTCLQGIPCSPISDRDAWTSFVSPEWWVRTPNKWFGGAIPSQTRVREWYCDDDPRLYLGTRRNGQLGRVDVYVRNSNPNIKSECDYFDSVTGDPTPGGGDSQCKDVNRTNPVPADCCGYCFLSVLHIMELFNCTGLTDLKNNKRGRDTIATFCRKTQFCREVRPCSGDPVRMGNPTDLLSASSSDIYCDPLDRGCEAEYVDGRQRSDVIAEILERRAAEEAPDPEVGPYFANQTSQGAVVVMGVVEGVANESVDEFRKDVNKTSLGMPLSTPDPEGRAPPKVCGYRAVCDVRLDSIRLRVGYYVNERLANPAGTPGFDYGSFFGGLFVFSLVFGCAGYLYWRRRKFLAAEKERKARKALKKYTDKRAEKTGLTYGDDGKVIDNVSKNA